MSTPEIRQLQTALEEVWKTLEPCVTFVWNDRGPALISVTVALQDKEPVTYALTPVDFSPGVIAGTYRELLRAAVGRVAGA